jgi:hypothetical protein
VVFSDGTDQAARVSESDMNKEMGEDKYEHYEIYAIGVGAELEEGQLKGIGRSGTEMASDRAKIAEAFDKIAEKVEGATKSFYLLSYCTPARAGEHKVKIEAKYKKKDEEASGTLEYEFDAEGFGPPPDCNPDKKPTFDLKDIPDNGDGDGGGGVDAKANANVKVGK